MDNEVAWRFARIDFFVYLDVSGMGGLVDCWR